MLSRSGCILVVVVVCSWFCQVCSVDLETCGSCSACEDDADACTSLSIAKGSEHVFCSTEVAAGEDMVINADIEVASLDSGGTGKCGTFTIEIFLKSQPEAKYGSSAESEKCYDPKSLMMDSTQIFAGSGDDQVCAKVMCDRGGGSDCQLMYQFKWSRTSWSEAKKAAAEAKMMLGVILAIAIGSCVFTFGIRGVVYFCCIKGALDRGEYSGTQQSCCIVCCCDCFCFGKLLEAVGYCQGAKATTANQGSPTNIEQVGSA